MDQFYLVLGKKTLDRFDFDDELLVDPQVRIEDPNRTTFIENRQLHLLSGFDAELIEFKLQGILIYSLEKTWAKGVVNFVGAADDFMCEVVDVIIFREVTGCAEFTGCPVHLANRVNPV